MTITLGELRSFAAEAASYSLSDAQGDRQVNRWINQAPRASASFSLTGGELIDSKDLTDSDEWELDVALEADVRFTLVEKLTPTTGVLDHLWTGTSGGGL